MIFCVHDIFIIQKFIIVLGISTKLGSALTIIVGFQPPWFPPTSCYKAPLFFSLKLCWKHIDDYAKVFLVGCWYLWQASSLTMNLAIDYKWSKDCHIQFICELNFVAKLIFVDCSCAPNKGKGVRLSIDKISYVYSKCEEVWIRSYLKSKQMLQVEHYIM